MHRPRTFRVAAVALAAIGVTTALAAPAGAQASSSDQALALSSGISAELAPGGTVTLDTASLQKVAALGPLTGGQLDTASLQTVTQLVNQIQGGSADLSPAVLAGIPGGIQDIVTLCGKILAGQAAPQELPVLVQTLLSPVQPCNQQTNAGGKGFTSTRHDLGRRGPATFTLRMQTYSIRDRIRVVYEGSEIFNSDWVGTNGDVYRAIAEPPGLSTSVLVYVDAPDDGTEWNYTVGCPA